MTGSWPQLLWLMFLLTAGAGLLSTLAVPAMIGSTSHARDPAARGRRVLLTAAFPWFIALTVGAALVATAASKAIGWIADHCPHHGLDHPHLCFSHLPAIDFGLVQGVFGSMVIVGILGGAARLAWAERRANREIGMLKALASSRGRLGIVPGRAPLAVAGGVLDPVVLLSRGLLDQLTLRQRRIVAAHEAAHLRHGDVWRNVLFELLLIAHLPRVRRKLREQWLRALEEHADDVVAQRFGAEDVVDVLLQVARLKLRQPPHGFSVAGSDLPGRVWRLLDGPRGDHGGSPFFAIVYASGLATLFAAAVTGHHTLETLLGLVAGH